MPFLKENIPKMGSLCQKRRGTKKTKFFYLLATSDFYHHGKKQYHFKLTIDITQFVI
jgi:hypothetical protein